MKKVIIFISGVILGAVFLGNGFYIIVNNEHKAYILNKYTRNVFLITSYEVKKIGR